MKQALTILLWLWGGAYFLYEGYEPFPAKDSLLQFSGNISFIGECKSTRRGDNKQRIKSSNEENELDFILLCSTSNKNLVLDQVGNKVLVLYKYDYEFFVSKRVDVYSLFIEGVECRSYDDREKYYQPASFYSLLMAMVFFLIGIRSLVKHLKSQSSNATS